MDVMLSLTTNSALGDGVAPDASRISAGFPDLRKQRSEPAGPYGIEGSAPWSVLAAPRQQRPSIGTGAPRSLQGRRSRTTARNPRTQECAGVTRSGGSSVSCCGALNVGLAVRSWSRASGVLEIPAAPQVRTPGRHSGYFACSGQRGPSGSDGSVLRVAHGAERTVRRSRRRGLASYAWMPDHPAGRRAWNSGPRWHRSWSAWMTCSGRIQARCWHCAHCHEHWRGTPSRGSSPGLSVGRPSSRACCSTPWNVMVPPGSRSSLGDEAVAGLITDAFGAPPDQGLLDLASGAAGDPWLLTELIRGLSDDGGVRVVDGCSRLASAHPLLRIDFVTRRRLDDLSGPARHLLQTAAVLGRSFRLEDLAEMLGETSAGLLPTLEEVADAGIVTAAEDAFSFRHELLRRAIAHLTPAPARKVLHRQFGQFLLNCGGSEVQAASHLLEAAHPGDPIALAGLDTAAARTLEVSPQSAARLALGALELTPAARPGAATRSVAAAEALTAAGQLDLAGRIAHDALLQPLQAADEARLRCALSSIRCMACEADLASADAQAVLAQPQLPPGVRDRAIIAHLQAAAGLCDSQAAGRAAARILAAKDEHRRPGGRRGLRRPRDDHLGRGPDQRSARAPP